MKRVLLILYSCLPLLVLGQKQVRTYYDSQKSKVQEEYYVAGDNETLAGTYKRFYENGKVMLEGNFEDGEKSGLFTEFHENGNLARKISFVNGMRHGVVEVFNEEGR